MNHFPYTFPQVCAPNLQYVQALTLMAFQQKMQQQLVLENFLQQRSSFDLQNVGENLKRMLASQTQLSNSVSSTIAVKVEETPSPQFSLAPKLNLGQTGSKKDIRPIVQYLINNLGTPAASDLSELQARYGGDELLNTLIDILSKKYTNTAKTKEEMVKYTLRKALRWLRLKVSRSKDADPKGGMKILIKQFFGEELKGQDGFENLDDDDLVDKFLPFKKDSKIKTMNTTFVTELFKSKEFSKEYNEFLKTFKNTMVTENDRKVEKFIKFLEECYSSGSFEKLKNYKRVPWLGAWVSNTMAQAKELPGFGGRKQSCSKTESSSFDEYEPKYEKKVKIEFVDSSSETNITHSPQHSE